MEWFVLIAIAVFLSNLFGKASPEKCPSCNGNGRTDYQDYDMETRRVYDGSTQCSVCSGAGRVRFVKKENGTKYYEPVWPKE